MSVSGYTDKMFDFTEVIVRRLVGLTPDEGRTYLRSWCLCVPCSWRLASPFGVGVGRLLVCGV